MLRFSLCAMAFGLSPSLAVAQSVEFRILERFNDTLVDVGDAPPTASPTAAGNANDRTLWFVVQARVTGLDPAGFNGLGGFTGTIEVTSGQGNGSFKAAGTGGLSGQPSNNSPVNFFPAGTSANGFLTFGSALYEPFRLVSNLGPGTDGTRLTPDSSSLINVLGAAGGASLDRLNVDDLSAAAWGVDTWVNVYAFQYDVLGFSFPQLTFATNFEAAYFTDESPEGVPNAIDFPQHSQGTYTIVLPGPAPAAVLGFGLCIAAGRRRRE